MTRDDFYNIHVDIPNPINTNYDQIAQKCDFETEYIQPTGSIISPYLQCEEEIEIEELNLSEDEALDLCKVFD